MRKLPSRWHRGGVTYIQYGLYIVAMYLYQIPKYKITPTPIQPSPAMAHRSVTVIITSGGLHITGREKKNKAFDPKRKTNGTVLFITRPCPLSVYTAPHWQLSGRHRDPASVGGGSQEILTGQKANQSLVSSVIRTRSKNIELKIKRNKTSG